MNSRSKDSRKVAISIPQESGGGSPPAKPNRKKEDDEERRQNEAKVSALLDQAAGGGPPPTCGPSESPLATRIVLRLSKRHVTLDMASQHLWPKVQRRVTRDLDTGEVISDEVITGLSLKELYRALDRPRRLHVQFFPECTGCEGTEKVSFPKEQRRKQKAPLWRGNEATSCHTNALGLGGGAGFADQ